MKINQTNIVGFLTIAILCLALNFGITTAAQENSRERIIVKPTATPKQTPNVKPTVAPTVFIPTPTVAPTATPTPVPIQTVADLQSKIRIALARPEIQRGQIGIKIVSLETNKIVFESNAEKYFMPASNMKSYTMAAALEKLSPDFKFVTSVFAAAKPDANGTIKGNLEIYGRGDVSFSTSFADGDYYKNLDALATKVAQAGVKKIEGDLIGDESYFSGNPVPSGWEWDDLQWYYGAEITALPVNDNAVDLAIKPTTVNSPCGIQILPVNQIVKFTNHCVTSAAGTKRDLQVFKNLNQNTIEISGTLPLDKDYKGYIAVSRPAQLFVELLRGLLEKKGVVITGQNKVIDAKDKAVLAVTSSVPPVEIARLESPPLSVIAAKTLKPSQNTYTETILRALGEQARMNPNLISDSAESISLRDPKLNSTERGIAVVRNFLNEVGIPSDSVIQWDGSGLSRHNLVTPASLVQLYTFMSKSRYANVWRDALPVGGVDGTLKSRFKDTLAANNLHAKTGTIDQVSALSGYVNSATGEHFVFSIIVNGVSDVHIRQATIDEIVLALSNFNGKTD